MGQVCRGSTLPSAVFSVNAWAFLTTPRGQGTPPLTGAMVGGGALSSQLIGTGRNTTALVWARAKLPRKQNVTTRNGNKAKRAERCDIISSVSRARRL